MKSKSFMLMVLSMGFGLIAAIGISQVMGNKASSAPAVKKGPVLVANGHLDHKSELTEENCRIEHWPLTLIPEGAASELDDVVGKIIMTRLRKGQVLISEDIYSREMVPGLAIPPGHNVINIKVPPEDIMNGLLNPGDKVDIIGVFKTQDKDRGRQRTEAKTFLKAIRVFNVNGSTSASALKEGKKSGGSGIVGVIVTESQAEKIVWVKKEGEIRLALRGEEDGDAEVEEIEGLFGQDDDFDDLAVRTASEPAKAAFQTVIWTGGSGKTTTSFDADNNQIKVEVSSGSGDGMNYGPPSGGGQGSSRDYEDSTDSGESDFGPEEDQYQGE